MNMHKSLRLYRLSQEGRQPDPFPAALPASWEDPSIAGRQLAQNSIAWDVFSLRADGHKNQAAAPKKTQFKS